MAASYLESRGFNSTTGYLQDALVARLVKPTAGTIPYGVRSHLKYDGTHAETRYHLSVKQASPFKSAGASVQSTTGS